MSSCPLCNRSYEDETLRFCLDDGTLLRSSSWSDTPPTVIIPSQTAESATTVPSLTPPPTPIAEETKEIGKPFRPMVPLTTDTRRSPVPWIVLGIVLVVFSIVGVMALISTQNIFRGNKQPASEIEQASIPSDSAATLSTDPSAAIPSTDPKVEEASDSAATIPVPKVQDSAPTATERSAKSPESERTPPPKPSPTATKSNESATKKTISGGVLNSRAISLPKPHYPAIAKQARVSGTVVVQVTIDENGNVISANAVSGHPLLQAASVAAARQARFSPTKLSGQPVKVTGVITYKFEAPEK